MEGARVKETEQSDGHKLCYGWDEPTNQPKKKKRAGTVNCVCDKLISP